MSPREYRGWCHPVASRAAICTSVLLLMLLAWEVGDKYFTMRKRFLPFFLRLNSTSSMLSRMKCKPRPTGTDLIEGDAP